MIKKGWQANEKKLLEAQTKLKENHKIIQEQLDEVELFIEAIRAKIKTFK